MVWGRVVAGREAVLAGPRDAPSASLPPPGDGLPAWLAD